MVMAAGAGMTPSRSAVVDVDVECFLVFLLFHEILGPSEIALIVRENH